MNQAIINLQQKLFGKDRETAVLTSTCVTCPRKNIWRFRTAQAEMEYRISGMCQHCQDSVFEKEMTRE